MGGGKRGGGGASGDRQLAVDDEVQLTIHRELAVLKLKGVIGGLRGTHWGRRHGQLAVTMGGEGVDDFRYTCRQRNYTRRRR